MMNHKKNTIHDYKILGAEMRLLKTLLTRMWVDSAKVCDNRVVEKIKKADLIIRSACSKCEADMFKEHPELGNDYLTVFYGATDVDTSKNEVDSDVLEIVKTLVEELTERKELSCEDTNS